MKNKRGYSILFFMCMIVLTSGILACVEEVSSITATPTYTVMFNSNGGSNIEPQTIAETALATEPDAPTKAGYIFAGWYTDATFTAAFVFTTPITEDIMLYAKWTTITFTVTFNSNGGGDVEPQTIAENTFATEPDAPTREGYTFEGWYKDEAFQEKFDFITTAITNNITLYANWTIITLTVTFNTNGGSDVASQNIEYGSSIAAPDAVLHSCYTTISGWYTDDAFTIAFNFDTDTITEDTTLFAQWDESTPNIEETPIASQAIYQICNWKQLQWIAQDPTRLDDNYMLFRDIAFPEAGENDFPAYGFIPIGYDVNPANDNNVDMYAGTPFSGTLDGNNNTISNLFINALDANWKTSGALIPDTILDNDFIGLFGHIDRAEPGPAVKNLTIILAPGTQDAPSINAKFYIGGLAGKMTKGVIENIAIKDGYIQGQAVIGGVIGRMEDGEARGYNANTTIHTYVDLNSVGIGGLVGQATKGTIIGYATGNIMASNAYQVGGLAGSANGTIIGYATGTIKGYNDTGGLVGKMTDGSITGYATGTITAQSTTGGLVASATNSYVVGYWDTASTGQTTSAGGTHGISDTQHIVFNNGYVDNKGTPADTGDDVIIFDNSAFANQFDVTNGANATWPLLNTTVFSLPQPTVHHDGTSITVVFPAP